MATTIGKLSAILSLNSAQFTRGMANARKSSRRFGGQMQSTIGMVRKFAGVLAGGLIVRSFVNAQRRSFETIDALAKTSERLGIATENLAGLRFAASQTGVNVKTLEMALQRMTRRLAEAAQGTGEARSAIKELGLNARELIKLPLHIQFSTIADRFADVAGQSDRVRLAFKLFDSEGVRLVNTLALGAEGLAKFQVQAEKAGLALSQTAVDRIVRANDAMDRLGKTMTGLSATLSTRLAPALNLGAEGLNKLLTQDFDANKGLGKLLDFSVGAALKFTAGSMAGFLRLLSAGAGLAAFPSIVMGNPRMGQNMLGLGGQSLMAARQAGAVARQSPAFLNARINDMVDADAPARSTDQQDEMIRILDNIESRLHEIGVLPTVN